MSTVSISLFNMTDKADLVIVLAGITSQARPTKLSKTELTTMAQCSSPRNWKILEVSCDRTR